MFSRHKAHEYDIIKEQNLPWIEMALETKTKLNVINEGEIILNYDDPYGLSCFNDSQRLLEHLKDCEELYSLSEYAIILERVNKILQKTGSLRSSDAIHKGTQNLKAIQGILVKKLKKISTTSYVSDKYHLDVSEDQRTEYLKGLTRNKEKPPKLGFVLAQTNGLSIMNATTWKLFESLIVNDKYEPNWREVYLLIMESAKAFNNPVVMTGVSESEKQKRIDMVYRKLERNFMLTVWEINMTYYRDVAQALVSVNRTEAHVFKKLENHIQNNLSMSYEVSTMTDLLISFGKARQGSDDLFEDFFFVITHGHPTQRNKLNLAQVDRIPNNPKTLLEILDIVSWLQERNPEFEVKIESKALLQNKVNKLLPELPFPVLEHMFTGLPFVLKMEEADVLDFQKNVVKEVKTRFGKKELKRLFDLTQNQLLLPALNEEL